MAHRLGLAGETLPRCTSAAEPNCTQYRGPQWYAENRGKGISLRIVFHGGEAALRASRTIPGGYAFLAGNQFRLSRGAAYTFTIETRELRGVGLAPLQMQLACFSRGGVFLTYGPISNLRLLGPAPTISAPDDRGFVTPTRTWRRFGGFVSAAAWPKGTFSIRPQFSIYRAGRGTGQLELRAVQLYRSASVSPARKRNLVTDPSFASGIQLVESGAAGG